MKDKQYVQSVVRALRILDSFSFDQQTLSISELSVMLNLPKSTVFRLLNTLMVNQFIEQDIITQRYKLGVKLFNLGNIYAAYLDLRMVALPIMHDLNNRTFETVSLSVVDLNSRVCIEKVESNHEIRNFVKVGARSSLCFGASGKVLLAYLPLNVQKEIIAQAELNNRQLQKLYDNLEQIREKKYELTLGERIEGLLSISVPIFDSNRKVIACISLSGPIARTVGKKEELLQEIMKSAEALSRKMGFV